MMPVFTYRSQVSIRSFLLVCMICCVGHAQQGMAQPVYMMQNALVTDCEGTLTDSENGPEEGQYDHNEDYTFTICVDNANEIIIAFAFFSLEETYDVLLIYDGPDTTSPLIASLTGSIQPPPVVVATSGCVTFHFTSDDNIVAAGWELNWSVEIDDPVPPSLQVVSMLDCPMSAITFQFDLPVECDMLTPDHFTMLGPGSPTILQINPLDCIPGELGQLFEVVFSAPLDRPGIYRLLFSGAIQDVCGEWHDVTANVIFELMNCPFDVVIDLVSEACAGDCGRVGATIIGDAGVPYQFIWSHTVQNASEVDVCTDAAILISVTVTDPVSMQTETANYNYLPLELPVILNPIGDTVCSSMGDHFFQSSLPGGRYYSTIIPEWLQQEGRYQFWRWNTAIGLSMDIVTYIAPNGCEAYDTVYVLPVNPGSIEAACVGAADFMVNGGNPPGGIWQGPNITTTGIFSPVSAGSFIVNYTAPNGCIGYKRINVQNGITLPDVDTICSAQEFDLVANPYGGIWSGPGIVNPILGRIRGWIVAPNQTYQYVYTIQGCTDTIAVYIQELWAGPDITLCDDAGLMPLSQVGTWTGPGVYLPLQNAFDISMLGPGEYDYTISAFGCTDVFRLYLIDPFVDPYAPISFCQENAWIPLIDYVDYGPAWGFFSGTSIVENNDAWYFNPALAGAGMHTILFEAVGCRDSFLINVEPYAQIPDYSFCELSPAQILTANPPGGTWSGPGFLDTQIGLFDPQLLIPGSYPVTYTAPSGCVTNDTIDIILREEVDIAGVTQLYCFSDTLIDVVISPLGGEFYINDILSAPQFNPSVLGTGTHELYYTRGTGPCASRKRVFISVMSPITGVLSPVDSICIGANTVIEVDANGGSGTLTAVWDQGLGFGSSHIVRPEVSTTYTVTVSDGCSDPFTGSAFVYVHQPFDIDIMTGPAVCFEDTSFIEIVPPSSEYVVHWLLDTIYESTYLEGPPGIYTAEVTELFSNCLQQYELQIPGPPPLQANFTIIPNQPCIDIIDNTIQVIDLATGYTGGWIDFGDGSGQVQYVHGATINHAYTSIGEYTITLIVTNDLGCADTLTRHLCVKNRVAYFVPTAFSPNDDGTNDFFRIETIGVDQVVWAIFSRFGEKVFEANHADAAWDGTFNGELLDPGVFVVHLRYADQVTGERGEIVKSVTLVR